MSNQTKPLFANAKLTLRVAERALPHIPKVCYKFLGRLQLMSITQEPDGCSVALRYHGVYAFANDRGEFEPNSFERFDSFIKDLQGIRAELMAIDGAYDIHGQFDFDTYWP